MSSYPPELDLLDQLCGYKLPVSVCERIFPDREHFERAVKSLLAAGHIRISDADGLDIPTWMWDELCRDKPDDWEQCTKKWQMHITPAGAAYFGS